MKKILAFAGSNSSTSINHQLVSFVASKIHSHEVDVIQLGDYQLPMYSIDLENEKGFPAELSDLLEKLNGAEGVLISVNEHNGTVSAFFKNVLDWLSRIEYKFLGEKKVMIMSTSPGKRGGLSANEYCTSVLPRFGAEIFASLTFPSFSENFSSDEKRISNDEQRAIFDAAVSKFSAALNS